MKKLLLISILMGALPFSMVAQDDDLYFVPKKKVTEKKVADNGGLRTEVYHSGSNRSVDEYNRMESKYVVIGNDSVNDIIEFSGEKGIYPDSLSMAASDSLVVEDYALTKNMMRFDDYDLTQNAAFWAGYHAGMDTWNWHTPWYYRTYGWYGGWYDPWYYSYGIYDPWYYRYSTFYDPWYYGTYGWYGGWYDPWRYSWGYYPYGYYYYDYAYYPYYRSYGGGGRYHNTYTGNTGTINRNGSTHGYFAGDRSVGRSTSSSGLSSSRSNSLRNRTVGEHNSRVNRSGSTVSNNRTSNSGNFSGSRSTSTYSNNSVNTSRSNSTYSSGSSSGGSFSGGGGGSFSGGGGGGSRGGGGGSLGGRR